uniref:Uncharacterized protein n=1 Tax=Anopheles culicifacies TaxID=139723 RepID=A0A182M7T2_9DIPT
MADLMVDLENPPKKKPQIRVGETKSDARDDSYLEVNLPILDPPDDNIRTVDGTVGGEPEPDVTVRAGLHLERDVLLTDAPQQPIVLVQIDRMVPVGGGGHRRQEPDDPEQHFGKQKEESFRSWKNLSTNISLIHYKHHHHQLHRKR